MDDLLEQMALLADQAGDWRDHLPYAATARFLEDTKYQELYGAHVDACQYCRQLIDALHPGEHTLAKLLSHVHDVPLRPAPWVDVAEAVAEARWNLDSIRDVLVAQPRRVRAGTLRRWANTQQWLANANLSSEGADSSSLAPWSATVAFSLDTHPDPNPAGSESGPFGDLVEEATSFLLAFGFRVAHAGDLRPGSISERIFDLAHQYGRRRAPTSPILSQATTQEIGFGVTGYCAWPMHIGMTFDEFETCEADFGQLGMVKWLTLDGEPRPYSHFAEIVRHKPADDEWEEGLSALRKTMVDESFARIAMGGSTRIGHGAMPSLAQDALVSLRNQQPLYVLGGFGGCARNIATTLGWIDAQPTRSGTWQCLDEFSPYIGAESLHNGLDASENRTLAMTADVEEAMHLVLQGLGHVAAQ